MYLGLKNIPERKKKPRAVGLNMIMDKGMSVGEVENILNVGKDYIDYVKFGFGTALVSQNIKEKVRLFKENNIQTYLGGTLFEAFLIRNQLKDYEKMLEALEIESVEISDGSINIDHGRKCELIDYFVGKNYTVLSEVGSKDADKVMAPYRWLHQMKSELDAGASYVIAEAREAGNIGLYRNSGEVREGLIEEILTGIKQEKIIWEAPQKSQQVFFIKLLGANVNLGNIAPNELIALEATRIGLRGDTFDLYL